MDTFKYAIHCLIHSCDRVYVYSFYGTRKKISPRTTRIIRVLLFALAPVLVVFLAISQYNIYPGGYWVTKVIFWSVVFLMMILYGLGNKSVLGKFERIIYKFFFYLPLGWIPFLMIPFIGIGSELIFYFSFIGDKSYVVYSDANIRIEQTGVRLLGPDPPLAIYMKDGLFAHKDTVLSFGYNAAKDSMRVRRLNDSTYYLTHYDIDNRQVPEGVEEYKFSINSRENTLQKINRKISILDSSLTRSLQIGDKIQLSGGYDFDPLFLKNPPASFRLGTVILFIKGQDESPAAVVRLDQKISGLNVTGDIVVLELRQVGQTWMAPSPVHIELCNFMPDDKPWNERRQGEWIEAAATVTLVRSETSAGR